MKILHTWNGRVNLPVGELSTLEALLKMFKSVGFQIYLLNEICIVEALRSN